MKTIIEFINAASQSTDEDLLYVVHTTFMEHVANSPIAEFITPQLAPPAREMLRQIVEWRPDPQVA